MSDERSKPHDAVTTPVGVTTVCPQCGVVLDARTTMCGACGAVITGGEGARGERVRAKLQQQIGDAFVIGDLLGRGGMGIVFRAREVALDRDVALKVLAFDPVLNPEAYARFEREARLAARLDHPNIVPIFSVGQRNSVAFYTMRLVKGGSVEQMVTPGRGLDVPHAVAILRDVASALDYAHDKGVVHRDIKPANILIGESGHAMVADFGIARALGVDSGAAATSTGVVGSPAYMSPEQWRGEKVDGKADQYALGVLAFELLTGTRPFADASVQELLRMHVGEEPPDILSVRKDLPSHLTDAIRGAMAKDPADRFPNTLTFVSAIEGDVRAVTTTRMPGAAAAAPTLARTTVKHGTPMPSPKTRPAPAASPRTGASPLPASPSRPWLVAALLLVLGALSGVILVELGKLNRGTTATPPATPAGATGAASVDSVIARERELEAEIARMQKEFDDAKRIALDAEHSRELMAAAQRGANPAKGEAAEPPHAHLIVMVRGGTPQVLVDGRKVADASPAVIEVVPGRHNIAVRGRQEFVPPEISLDLAANDTQQVVFMTKAAADAERRRVYWSSLSPQQREILMRMMKQGDSVPQAPGKRP